jgi:hypothetical protein
LGGLGASSGAWCVSIDFGKVAVYANGMRSLSLFMAVMLTGCLHSHMKSGQNPQALVAPAGDAVVVFAQGSTTRSHVYSFVFVDEQKRCLGDLSRDRSFFTAQFSPGEHSIIVVGQNAMGGRINVEAGKTYIVELKPPQDGTTMTTFPLEVHSAVTSWSRGGGMKTDADDLVSPGNTQYATNQAQCTSDWKLTDANFEKKAQAVLDAMGQGAPAPFVKPEDGAPWKGTALASARANRPVAEPPPTEPPPTEPPPTEPPPTEPPPTEPASTEPASTEPAPTESAP